MEYNPANWGSQQLRDDFPIMAQKITSTGGQAILKEESHSAILKSILNLLNT
jgi:hypothetical protein